MPEFQGFFLFWYRYNTKACFSELSDTNTQMFIIQINVTWQKGHLFATCYQLRSTITSIIWLSSHKTAISVTLPQYVWCINGTLNHKWKMYEYVVWWYNAELNTAMAPRSGYAQVWTKFQVPFEEFPSTLTI